MEAGLQKKPLVLKYRGLWVRKHARLIKRGLISDSFLLALLPISGKLSNNSGRQVAGKVGNSDRKVGV